jgi:large subunit ribosomal protein L2
MLRLVDFRRDKLDVPAKVIGLEYDPNRSARIALLQYTDGEKRYIIAPVGLNVNEEVVASKTAEIKVGNAMPLDSIPPGIPIHNVEFKPGSGARIARSAGNSCVIMAKEGGFAHVKLPSGEIRLIGLDCFATIGQVGNIEHETISIGKAGRSRWMGLRPYSRGVAKNPHDHPMGGGEGKASGGQPRSPWGQYAKGLKTRHKKRYSDKYILNRRK